MSIDGEATQAAAPHRERLPFFRGLAGRLLAVTFAVVLVAEAVVFVPGLANFHGAWLRDRINLAETAALAVAAAPQAEMAASLRSELLASAGVHRIAVRRADRPDLLIAAQEPAEDAAFYDYSVENDVLRFAWAVETFVAPSGRYLLVRAPTRLEGAEMIEIELAEDELKRAMGVYAARSFTVATLISLTAGAIVYFVLAIAFVQPVRRLTNAIERFRDRPEDASIPFRRSSRADEIGRAERAAAQMADEIRSSLRQRERLAALGGAVARIAHDLRNILTTAQIVTERLAASDDPSVRQLAQRLERSIGRAAGLASSTARFGRADEQAPVLAPIRLAEALTEAAGDALAAFAHVGVEISVEPGLVAIADEDQLHRIVVNLMRNAAQALNGRADARIVLRAQGQGANCRIDVIDNGPGVSEAVQARLFEPFASTDSHGAGLGLAIARELARAQGGEVELAETSAAGARFSITLPRA